MDFAADAVLDTIAPPPRPAAGKSAHAPQHDDAPSFDDHLNAEIQDEAPAESVDTKARAPEANGETPSNGAETAESIEGGETPATTTSSTDASTAAAVMLQVIAAAPTTPATPPPTANKQAAAVSAPAAAPAPTNQGAAPQPETPAPQAPTVPTSDATANAGEGAEAGEASPAAQKTAPATTQPAAPQQSAQTASTPAAPVVQPQQAASSATQASAEAAVATPPVATTATAAASTNETAAREAATPRTGKSNAARAETEEVQTRDPRAAPPAAQGQAASKAQTKVAPASTGAKEAFSPSIDTASSSAPQSTHAATSTAHSASQTQHAALDQAATRAAPAAHQVGREIVRQFNGDSTRFELRLDPPELGRVEVKLEVSRDHRVTAVIAADSPQALTELARHARELEQMLQSAGLELSDSGLSFDLRQGNDRAHTAEDAGTGFGEAGNDATTEQQAQQARPLGYERWRGVRVDLMV